MAADVPGSTRGAASRPSSGGDDAQRVDDPTIIFLHIGKTAGTTLRQVLRRNVRRGDIMVVRARRRPREETLTDFEMLPERERAKPRLIAGHTIFGLHTLIPRPSTYITMLRDPVRLAVSQYSFVQRTEGHRHHEAARGMSLAEYANSGLSLEMDNSQTRALAGDVGTPFGECTPEMLTLAKQHVEEHFSVVGLTERFDESLVLLGEAFGWRRLWYVRANVARSGSKLSADDRRLLKERSSLDMELYAWAAERFDRLVRDRPEFDADLERLRRLNRAYRPVGLVTHTYPSRLRTWVWPRDGVRRPPFAR
jgi:hypothetical protein